MEVLHGVQHLAVEEQEHMTAGVLLPQFLIGKGLDPGDLLRVAAVLSLTQQISRMAAASSSAPEEPRSSTLCPSSVSKKSRKAASRIHLLS